ncbi:Fc receptor-like protein 2 [Polypterus senegalus]|uniref:Fc receptor-like protein 2 n=1 Tax=Polypterus senegalus TaxID=55291 RepID=UPI00196610B3|nr:Fc receptor-like protein 2 [Polypterus senegalus]
MECSVEGSVTNWTYRFYKSGNRHYDQIEKTKEHTYTIESVIQSDSGEYGCDSYSADYRQVFGSRNPVTLTVHELFSKPTLTVQPNTILWEGDNVTLKCQSESKVQQTQLRYKFYKDKQSVSQRASESEFRIPSARPETSGSYWCVVGGEGKKTEKKSSERVQVTVRELFTKPTLTVHPSTILWQGDNVTLRCQSESRFQGTPLTYKFYRDEEPVSQRASELEFTISSARPEKSGSYWCEVEEEGKKTEKKTSVRVQVTVRGNRNVTLTLRTEGTPVYIGDKVTMECSVEGSVTDWTYRFYKVVNEHYDQIKAATERTYTIESVIQSDSGGYGCDFYSADYRQALGPSNRVTLTVHELLSKPTLIVHPSTTLREGDAVTLRCQSESQVQQTQLWYKFYRDEESVSQRASESEFRIPSARPETSGSYWCEVEAEGKKIGKKTSERVQVTVKGIPKATLALMRHRDVVYTGDTVAMNCSIDGSFTDWRYQWYRGNVANRGSPIKDVTGQTYTIQSVTQSDSGPYWCEAHRDDPLHHSRPSNAVTLTVKELFTKPTLTVHPSTTLWQEDNVTLRCQSESRFQGTPLTYKFYRDEEPVSQGLSESEFTIPSARPEKSGSYWCEVGEEGKKTEKKTSERVQVTVRESSSVMISFILRASLFLLMLLPVLVVYQMTEGFSCFDCKKARRLYSI